MLSSFFSHSCPFSFTKHTILVLLLILDLKCSSQFFFIEHIPLYHSDLSTNQLHVLREPSPGHPHERAALLPASLPFATLCHIPVTLCPRFQIAPPDLQLRIPGGRTCQSILLLGYLWWFWSALTWESLDYNIMGEDWISCMLRNDLWLLFCSFWVFAVQNLSDSIISQIQYNFP